MGTLFIVSTPIGNLDDITIRAMRTLFSVDIIACEDTRRTGLLLQELKKRFANVIVQQFNNVTMTQLVRYDDRTEAQKMPELLGALQNDKSVALVSDAGTPLISDPGFQLVRECIRREIRVVSVPGPVAAVAALTSSGLPASTFLFLGYTPEKQSHRRQLFETLRSVSLLHAPLIFYCAPHKLGQTLNDMKLAFGDIEIVVARELTKIHEEVWRGKFSEALSHFRSPKGEFVLLIFLKR